MIWKILLGVLGVAIYTQARKTKAASLIQAGENTSGVLEISQIIDARKKIDPLSVPIYGAGRGFSPGDRTSSGGGFGRGFGFGSGPRQ